MRRREFIALVGGTAVAWPLAAHAQRDRVRRIGMLMVQRADDPDGLARVTAFAQALQPNWTIGRNVRIDYRWTGGAAADMRKDAEELVALAPDVIVTSGAAGVGPLLQATRSVPIVFVLVADPVGAGFVDSLARPGGNATGFIAIEYSFAAKQLELLKEIAPGVTRVAVIFSADTAIAAWLNRAIEAAAPSVGMTATFAPVHDATGIEDAVAAGAREPRCGLISLPGAFNDAHREVIAAAAVRHRLPLIGAYAIPRVGGLISYWFDTADLFVQAASYIDRILKGASPADLPVQQPTKYSLVINVKTAKALGLTVPQSLLARADEVIE
jgi:ABC-type uncharacterized transport system substrate-binding protein